MLRSMKRLQSPFKRTVVLDGHKTSINVEPEYWDQLRLITLERQTTMAKLITEIDRVGRLLPHRVKAPGLAVSFRPGGLLDRGQKPGRAGGHARG
jgi:predicted DNA-binding ribbon-helix-helix protein